MILLTNSIPSVEELVFNQEAYTAVFKRMKAATQPYPNYIFALTMGVGKTLLMATCIFYEFILANKFPDEPLYCHNALIFAPDKTVLQSLREIETFDYSKVLPPDQAQWLQSNLSLHYLDEAGMTLNVLNNSKYNLVVSNLSTEELQNLKSDKQTYEIRVLKKKSLKLTQVRHRYDRTAKELKDAVDFKADTWDVERYKLIETERDMTLQAGSKTRDAGHSKDISHLKDKREWTAYTLTAEIAKYLYESPLKIESILRESKEGLDALVALVNQYNELLYDEVIPALFKAMYDIEPYEKRETKEIAFVKEPEKGFYTMLGDPQKTQLFKDWMANKAEQAEKSFHLDTYCFASLSEQDFFKNVIAQDDVKEIYFTGMLTHGQTDLFINYIDPETHVVRNYYPDFLILTKDGEWLVLEVKAGIDIDDPVVQAKRAFAESILKESKIRYQIVPHSQVGDVIVGKESLDMQIEFLFDSSSYLH